MGTSASINSAFLLSAILPPVPKTNDQIGLQGSSPHPPFGPFNSYYGVY